MLSAAAGEIHAGAGGGRMGPRASGVTAPGAPARRAAWTGGWAVQTAPPPAAVTSATAPLASSAGTTGLAAEDADLIEKAWIEKAKRIVAETRGDPYAQNKEINKVKADYIKKRYNRDIKHASE